MDALLQKFNAASRVTQSLIIEQLNRDAFGQKKYGQTMDRQDLSTAEWLQHAIEEQLDLLKYLKAAKNSLDPDARPELPPIYERPDGEYPGENTPDNARQLTNEELIFHLFMEMQSKPERVQKTLTLIAEREPVLLKLIANYAASVEAGHYLKHPNERPSADVMLRMVGSPDREQQRDLIKQGLEHATGKPITFVDCTPKPKKSTT